MDSFKGRKGVWRTVNGRRIFIEEGKTLKQTFAELEEAGEKLHADFEEDKAPIREEMKKRSERYEAAKPWIASSRLPAGVKGEECLGGTMTAAGKPVDMRSFKEGYLVSCGNDSSPDNKRFLLSGAGKEFVGDFMEYSDDGELYVGSWFENGVNNNEPTIWVKDRKKAIELAKKTGQWSITDCAAYNRRGCENYKILNAEQSAFSEEIFIPVAKNGEEHAVRLEKVRL